LLISKIKGPRGNNLHDVEAPNGENYIVSMPVKFRKSIWTKRGKHNLQGIFDFFFVQISFFFENQEILS
jgi:hypothetical protein